MPRILVVEGNESAADKVRDSLRARPEWDVVEAATLMDAIRCAGEDNFDAAVLDAEMPDGSGLDILDFLRIGSPGIRILLVSQEPSESVAFHALSHGAGDYLVMDAHLDQELPRRIDALLAADNSPESALVQTLTPSQRYDFVNVIAEAQDQDGDATPVGAGKKAKPKPTTADTPPALRKALDKLVEGATRAVAVFDLRGKTIGLSAAKEIDAEGLGFAVGTLHGQVGGLWTYAGIKPTGYSILIDVDNGLLGITAIPGTYIVALSMDSATNRKKALDKLDQAAREAYNALSDDE